MTRRVRRHDQRAERTHAAISLLASLFEYGELQAETDPAAFIQGAADEIVKLRAGLAIAERAARLEVVARVRAQLERYEMHPDVGYVIKRELDVIKRENGEP